MPQVAEGCLSFDEMGCAWVHNESVRQAPLNFYISPEFHTQTCLPSAFSGVSYDPGPGLAELAPMLWSSLKVPPNLWAGAEWHLELGCLPNAEGSCVFPTVSLYKGSKRTAFSHCKSAADSLHKERHCPRILVRTWPTRRGSCSAENNFSKSLRPAPPHTKAMHVHRRLEGLRPKGWAFEGHRPCKPTCCWELWTWRAAPVGKNLRTQRGDRPTHHMRHVAFSFFQKWNRKSVTTTCP